MPSKIFQNAFKSKAAFILNNGYGFGQVEPNHLSAQATKEVYAQLPAKSDIDQLENGQFVKYNYAEGVVDFDGPGEWMLVFNEIKLYRDEYQSDAEFAMLKDNYMARVYSPYDDSSVQEYQSRYYGGKDAAGADIEKVTMDDDPYEFYYNDDPFKLKGLYKEKMMPEGTTMVPRVLKTHVGDIFTTNMIGDATVAVDARLSPRAADGILSTSGDNSIVFQVVKVYTMPDGQPGAKLMRIK